MVQGHRIVIVTPALADANNGNARTALRWAAMLRRRHRVDVALQWETGTHDLMIALHARRSAASIRAWREHAPARPQVLVLTGTDLYQDIAFDADARASLAMADRLVVLNELGASSLPPELRSRAVVVLQSCTARRQVAKPSAFLRAVAVGHLRAVKAPQTLLDAVRLLARRSDIRVDLIGAALEPALGAAAEDAAREATSFRWLGARPHPDTRRRIQHAHVLVHPSTLEGGAHVIIEAIRSGTPVLASRVDGNVGLLGADYAGYFPVGNAAALAQLLERARDDADWLNLLTDQCAARAPLFEPQQEASTLLALVDELLTAG